MHLDRDVLERINSGRVQPTDKRTADEHLSTCEACRERLEEVRIFSLLEALDDPAPDVSVEDVIARAEEWYVRGWGRWAAALALTFGAAGALYAAPGWIDGLFSPGPGEQVEAEAEPPDWSGVVVSAGARLVIELEARTSRTIGLRLVAGSDVTVEALDAATTFDSYAERLVVRSAAVTDYRVAIPRGAPSVEVRVGDRPVFALRNGEVTTSAREEGPGSYSIDFRDDAERALRGEPT